MTEEELIKKLNDLEKARGGDPEAAHSIADRALERFLEQYHPDVCAALQSLKDACGAWWTG